MDLLALPEKLGQRFELRKDPLEMRSHYQRVAVDDVERFPVARFARFQPVKRGVTHMNTDFASQINQCVFAYLTTCRSSLAFLSTLTLNLFEKQAFQGN